MSSSFSGMAYLAISRRYYYLRVRLGPAIAPFQPLEMSTANMLRRTDTFSLHEIRYRVMFVESKCTEVGPTRRARNSIYAYQWPCEPIQTLFSGDSTISNHHRPPPGRDRRNRRCLMRRISRFRFRKWYAKQYLNSESRLVIQRAQTLLSAFT